MASDITATIPSSLPNGAYLFRIEHIALHQSWMMNGAQFYMSCGQLDVQGGGNGSPGPLGMSNPLAVLSFVGIRLTLTPKLPSLEPTMQQTQAFIMI
jgi:hypothetical protein